jgi:hypothetical protein
VSAASVRERVEAVEAQAREGLVERVAAFCEDWPGWDNRDEPQSLTDFFWEVVFNRASLPLGTVFDDDLLSITSTVVITGSLEAINERPLPAMCVDVDWREVSPESLQQTAQRIFHACTLVAERLDETGLPANESDEDDDR